MIKKPAKQGWNHGAQYYEVLITFVKLKIQVLRFIYGFFQSLLWIKPKLSSLTICYTFATLFALNCKNILKTILSLDKSASLTNNINIFRSLFVLVGKAILCG